MSVPRTRPLRAAAVPVVTAGLIVALAGVAVAVNLGPDTPVSDRTGAAPDGPGQAPPAGSGVAAVAALEGVVRAADGSPVAGAQIVVEPLPGGPAVPDLAVVSDAAGSYRWTLAPGTYRVTATSPRGASVPVEVVVTPGAARADLTLPPAR